MSVFNLTQHTIQLYIATEIVANDGLPCWNECNQTDGPCVFCGNGLCCKKNDAKSSKSCKFLGKNENNHTCVNGMLDTFLQIKVSNMQSIAENN